MAIESAIADLCPAFLIFCLAAAADLETVWIGVEISISIVLLAPEVFASWAEVVAQPSFLRLPAEVFWIFGTLIEFPPCMDLWQEGNMLCIAL